jgi:hypothetical protein
MHPAAYSGALFDLADDHRAPLPSVLAGNQIDALMFVKGAG